MAEPDSPLLASMRLAMDLCATADQLRQWWGWPPHREARWCLAEAEAVRAVAYYEGRLNALEHPAPPDRGTAPPAPILAPRRPPGYDGRRLI